MKQTDGPIWDPGAFGQHDNTCEIHWGAMKTKSMISKLINANQWQPNEKHMRHNHQIHEHFENQSNPRPGKYNEVQQMRLNSESIQITASQWMAASPTPSLKSRPRWVPWRSPRRCRQVRLVRNQNKSDTQTRNISHGANIYPKSCQHKLKRF